MSIQYPSRALAELLKALGRQPQERTQDEVFDALGLKDGIYFLTKLATAEGILGKWGIDIRPTPDGTFLLSEKNAGVSSEAIILDRLRGLESASQEFKSTYWCDLNRRSHQPSVTSQQLRSDDVKHSALKSVAGFLTTGGGTLFIGVDDAGQVLGLCPDLDILESNRQNVDQLINIIKTDISERFLNRNTVNDYISITAVDVGNEQILQLEVTSRRKLSFLKFPKRDHKLFRRQGNRTTEVKVYEVEEFLAWRRENILP